MPPIAQDDEDFKTFNCAADSQKTMGTLKLLTESMQYDFTVALDLLRVIRPFSFLNSRNHKHANIEALNFEKLFFIGWPH